jgi:hypothetical protein
MPKHVAKKKPVRDQELTAQIRLDVRPDTPSYYVNFIGVSHSAYDITLSAIKIPSPLTQEHAELVKSGEQLPFEPLVQLVMSPLLVDGLVKALIDQKARHEKTLAQQVKNNELLQHQYVKPIGTIQ